MLIGTEVRSLLRKRGIRFTFYEKILKPNNQAAS